MVRLIAAVVTRSVRYDAGAIHAIGRISAVDADTATVMIVTVVLVAVVVVMMAMMMMMAVVVMMAMMRFCIAGEHAAESKCREGGQTNDDPFHDCVLSKRVFNPGFCKRPFFWAMNPFECSECASKPQFSRK